MDINQKLEEIRNKPDEIRKKYVWIAVLISMIFIIIIWIFSFKENLSSVIKQENNLPELPGISEQVEKFNSQLPSLENAPENENSPADTSNDNTKN